MALRRAQQVLDRAGIPHDTAWSPAFRRDVQVDDAEPERYSHPVLALGAEVTARAVDPAADGAKVTAQASVCRTPGRRAHRRLAGAVAGLAPGPAAAF